MMVICLTSLKNNGGVFCRHAEISDCLKTFLDLVSQKSSDFAGLWNKKYVTDIKKNLIYISVKS